MSLELTLEELQHLMCYLNESDFECEVCGVIREKVASAILNYVPPELRALGVVSIERVKGSDFYSESE